MTTILRHNIRLVRPALIRPPDVRKEDRPVPKYNRQPKRIKEHCGKVVATCLKMKDGAILFLNESCPHIKVAIDLEVDYDLVKKVGWQLDNGEYLWK